MLRSTAVQSRVEPQNLLAQYSMEITAKDVEALRGARHGIPSGTAISVTFLPGEDMAARVSAAAVVRSLGFEPVPHISARRVQSREELGVFLERLRQEATVERVFVVAGDPPQPLGPFNDALAVIESRQLADSGLSCVS